MISAPLHPNEDQRLEALKQLEVLDTEDEKAFDELTELASAICGTPISLISLVDADRQWFKSKKGLNAEQTDRNSAFCAHAILQDQVLEVQNALEDERFHDNPLVVDQPDIRFYAGAPLVTADGHAIGTLCVIDQQPKQLDEQQKKALSILSKQVMSQLELRLHNRRLEKLNKTRDQIFAMVAHDLRSPFTAILGLSRGLTKRIEKLTPERIVESAHSILNSSMRVYQMLDELLQWSQQAIGDVELKPEVIVLDDLVQSVVENLEHAIGLKDIEIISDLNRKFKVHSDPMIAKCVLRNLLNNAIKYSSVGGSIEISARLNGNQVDISVLDHGIPLPDSARDALTKGEAECSMGTRGEKGHGLGLLLCHQFLHKQNNRLWLDEEHTEGACFIFNLPAIQ